MERWRFNSRCHGVEVLAPVLAQGFPRRHCQPRVFTLTQAVIMLEGNTPCSWATFQFVEMPPSALSLKPHIEGLETERQKRSWEPQAAVEWEISNL